MQLLINQKSTISALFTYVYTKDGGYICIRRHVHICARMRAMQQSVR